MLTHRGHRDQNAASAVSVNAPPRYLGLMFRLASWSVVLLLSGAANPALAQERLDAAAVDHPTPYVVDPHIAPPDFEGGLDPLGSAIDVRVRGGNPAAAQNADGTWSVPFVHPAPRYLHCAIYDPGRQRMIVFGGYNRTLDLIWALSLGDRPEWSFFLVSGPVPVMRYGATAIYDPVRDRVIMFGGAIPPYLSQYSDEVWALSLSGIPGWTQLQVSGTAPPGRYQHTAIYDSNRDRMIVYGGWSGASTLGDVWALDLAGEPSWTEIVPSTPLPPPRAAHAATYDAVRDRMIVFGGMGPGFGSLNDTWELALSGAPSWQSIAFPDPAPRQGHNLIYDPIGDRAVLLGGYGSPNFYPEIWILPAGQNHWTRYSNLTFYEIKWAPAIYDAGHHRIVAYNGRDAMDIPAFELADPINNFSPLLPRPVYRTGQTAIYDPARERMLMFLGSTQDGWIDQTWELSLKGTVMWSRLATNGAYEREDQSAIYDPVRDRMVVFGGWGSNETWELRLSAAPAWNRLSPEGGLPEQRPGHSAIYDPLRDRMIVFGGLGYTSSRDDAWALSLAGTPVWSSLPPGPRRAWHNAIYDPVGDRMLVFGGAEDRFYQWTNEVWSLSLAGPMTWSLLSPAGDAPAPRHLSSASYDPIRHRVVVFGGCCFEDEDWNSQAFADAWELSLDGPLQWRALTIPSGPPGRRGASLIYDPPRDRAILYGGYGGDDGDKVYFEDVRTLTWGDPARPSVSCPGSVVPDSPLRLSYVVSNPLPTTRAIEWTLTSERDWPGFPLRGLRLVGGGSSDTVRLELAIPDSSFEAPNTLAFASWFSGAQSHGDACQHLVQGRTPAMGFDFTPHTLSLASQGLWVTGFLEPASPFAASDIDVASIRLNGTVPVDPAAPTALGDHDANGVPDLMVKFNRVAVELTVSEGDSVAVTVTGTVDGHSFVGTDYIRVRRAVVTAPAAGSHLTAGSVSQVRWQTPSGVTVESVALLHSPDGGSTWSLIARGQPNTGSYDWTVPSVQTDQAKVAVVLVEFADETGYIVDGVLGVSEMFSIAAVVGVGDLGPGEFALAIRGPTPNPAAEGRLRVEFALRDGSPARLELVDVAGRVLITRQVGSLGPGTHALDLSEGGALRPGIYFLRLTQGGSEVRARVAVLR